MESFHFFVALFKACHSWEQREFGHVHLFFGMVLSTAFEDFTCQEFSLVDQS